MIRQPSPRNFRVDHLRDPQKEYMLDFLKSWLEWAMSESPKHLAGIFMASDGLCHAARRWDQAMTPRGSNKHMDLACQVINAELHTQHLAGELGNSHFPFNEAYGDNPDKSFYTESAQGLCPLNKHRRAWVQAFIDALEGRL